MADDWRMDINTRAFHVVQQSIGEEPKKKVEDTNHVVKCVIVLNGYA